MTAKERSGRKARRARREQARALAKELERQKHSRVHWGSILTYWGTFASVLGLAVALAPSKTLSSILYGFALLQLILGLHLWIKLSRKLKIIATVLGVVLFTFLDWRWIVRSARVTVSPSAVTFDAVTLGGDSYTFVAKNDTQDDLYTVVLRLRIEPGSLSATDFRLTIPENDRRFVGEFPMGDIMGLYCTSQAGRPELLVSIYQLSAQESRRFVIKRIKNQWATMQAGLAYSSSDPRPIGSRFAAGIFPPAVEKQWVDRRGTGIPFPTDWLDKQEEECSEISYTTRIGDVYSGDGHSFFNKR
jgi:hypothetical protein